jgi:hypothetical protein
VKAVVVPTGEIPREKRLDGGEEEEEEGQMKNDK